MAKEEKDLRPFTLGEFVAERRKTEEDLAVLEEFLACHNAAERGSFDRFSRGFKLFKEKIYGLRGKRIVAPGGDLVNTQCEVVKVGFSDAGIDYDI